MDQNTLTLIGITECLSHLVNKERRNKRRQAVLRTLEETKANLIASSIAHSACRQSAASTVQAAACAMHASFSKQDDLNWFLQDLQQVCVFEVWPPPLPSSSSDDKSGPQAAKNTPAT